MLSVNIIGTNKIQNSLKNKVTPEKLEQQLEQTAIQIRDLAKQLAPVDSGTLRNSITHWKPAPLTRNIGTSVEYAPYQEFGTRKMMPHPFLRPALLVYQHQIIKTL